VAQAAVDSLKVRAQAANEARMVGVKGTFKGLEFDNQQVRDRVKVAVADVERKRARKRGKLTKQRRTPLR
jgi:hypothetical protein